MCKTQPSCSDDSIFLKDSFVYDETRVDFYSVRKAKNAFGGKFVLFFLFTVFSTKTEEKKSDK